MIEIKCDGGKISTKMKGKGLDLLAEAGVIFHSLRKGFADTPSALAVFDITCMEIISGLLDKEDKEDEETEKEKEE